MKPLTQLRVACFATDGVEEIELTDPVKALKEAGATVDIISLKPGKIQAFHHHDKASQIDVDRTLDEIQPGMYHAVLLPGGALNADKLRTVPKLQLFLRTMQDIERPIAAICHAAWILISSGVVEGRTLTSYSSIRDDVRNAGGHWVDEEVVVDGNWVTSRKPDDLPAFNRETIRMFSRTAAEVRTLTASINGLAA